MSADDAAAMGWVKTIPAFLHILISAETLQVETAENVTNSANPSLWQSAGLPLHTNRRLRQCGNLPLWQSADRESTGDRPSLGRSDVRVAALVWALGLIPVLVRWTGRPSPGRCLRVPLPFEDVHQIGMSDELGPNLAGHGVVADQPVLNDADLPGRVLVAVPAHERVVDPAAFRPDRQAWGWDGRNAPASPVAIRGRRLRRRWCRFWWAGVRLLVVEAGWSGQAEGE